MRFEFENGVGPDVPEKLLIAATKSTLIAEVNNQDLVNAFQDDPKTKRALRPKSIVKTMRLMDTEINLTRAKQIIVVEPEYISYAENKLRKGSRGLASSTIPVPLSWSANMSKLSGG